MIQWLQSEPWNPESNFEITGEVFGVTLYVIAYDPPFLKFYRMIDEDLELISSPQLPSSRNVFRHVTGFKKTAEEDFKKHYGASIAAVLRRSVKSSRYRSIDAPLEE